MIGFLRQLIEHRRAIRRRWQEDARQLAATDPVNAYYEAQRRAAPSCAQGHTNEHWHWAKVASEVARINPVLRWTLKSSRRWRIRKPQVVAEHVRSASRSVNHRVFSDVWGI